MKLRCLSLTVAFAFACATSHVPRSSSRHELQRYVERAARLVEERGAASCSLFGEPQWMNGDYYIFVTDAQSNVTVCHPVRPDLVGQSQTDLRDSSGKYFIREMLAAASGRGRAGWIEYQWPRPGETAPATKVAYVVGVTAADGKQYVVGSGGYVD